MSSRPISLAAALLSLALVITVPLARADAPATAAASAAEVQLQRALDNPIDLTLDKTELAKAFDAIASKGKISLQIDQACYDALPYGATTRVNVVFRASPLRLALDEVLSPLGLEQSVSGNTVTVRPTPALQRVGRRAEFEELKLLQTLRQTQLPTFAGDWTETLRTLLGKPEMTVQLSPPSDPAASAAADKALAQVKSILPCTVAQALDAYSAGTGEIWTVNAQNVLILPMKKWIGRQLERPIVIHQNNAPLADVIAELAHLSRIRFQPEPGLYQAVPTVSLNSDNGTVQQTLDALSGATSIAYDVRDDSIFLHLANKPRLSS